MSNETIEQPPIPIGEEHDPRDIDNGNVDLSPEPLPLAPKPLAYPVEALGPVLGPAAKRIAYHVQAPLGMACQSVLGAAALVVQGHYDVKRGNIGTGPVSLFLFTEAESGERKSTVDNVALAPIRAIEAEQREQFDNLMTQYKANDEAWELRRKSIIAEVEGKGKGKQALSEEQQTALGERLAAHDVKRPQAPPMPNLTFSEPTAEGMYKHLKTNRPSAGLYSDEAIGFFGGHGMSDEARGRTIEALCRLWDGAPLTRTRGTVGESGILAGRRLSTHLMMQPVVAEKVLGDTLLQGQGFLPRFLICRENSLIGTRFLADRDPSEGVENDPAIATYRRRIDALARKPLPVNDSGELEPKLLTIKGHSFSVLSELHDGIEAELLPNGEFYDVRAFASKATENASRLAAVMAVIEECDEITSAHIERAGQLVAYYLETMKARTEEAQQDQQERQARDLLEWINTHGGQLNQHEFKRLPSACRSAKKARPLLDWLTRAGYLRCTKHGPSGKAAEWETVTHV
ncbi:YfjI family protein [Halomonas meridiana]|uniref:YfjI family protein n=1 Tax=Vreelandella aquamarina TaxID=77097 RepID=UPI00273C87A1|nr:YfjI family protein [Halomonas meridiana]MDP4556257.1 YfjI family protein [Halomonas meridiana]